MVAHMVRLRIDFTSSSHVLLALIEIFTPRLRRVTVHTRFPRCGRLLDDIPNMAHLEQIVHLPHIARTRTLPDLSELSFLKHFVREDAAPMAPRKKAFCHSCISHPVLGTAGCSIDMPVREHVRRTALALFVLDVTLVGFDLSLLMAVLH